MKDIKVIDKVDMIDSIMEFDELYFDLIIVHSISGLDIKVIDTLETLDNILNLDSEYSKSLRSKIYVALDLHKYYKNSIKVSLVHIELLEEYIKDINRLMTSIYIINEDYKEFIRLYYNDINKHIVLNNQITYVNML